jgi:hypothetical protein
MSERSEAYDIHCALRKFSTGTGEPFFSWMDVSWNAACGAAPMYF